VIPLNVIVVLLEAVVHYCRLCSC